MQAGAVGKGEKKPQSPPSALEWTNSEFVRVAGEDGPGMQVKGYMEQKNAE